jgi:hypothetical protein
MHNTAMVFIETVLSCHPVEGKSVPEVGSYNVNGSVRDWVEQQGPASYFGVDLQPQARYVDETLSANDLIARFGRDAFDVVTHAWQIQEESSCKTSPLSKIKIRQNIRHLTRLGTKGAASPTHIGYKESLSHDTDSWAQGLRVGLDYCF